VQRNSGTQRPYSAVRAHEAIGSGVPVGGVTVMFAHHTYIDKPDGACTALERDRAGTAHVDRATLSCPRRATVCSAHVLATWSRRQDSSTSAQWRGSTTQSADLARQPQSQAPRHTLAAEHDASLAIATPERIRCTEIRNYAIGGIYGCEPRKCRPLGELTHRGQLFDAYQGT
jgi:hypothetical protein